MASSKSRTWRILLLGLPGLILVAVRQSGGPCAEVLQAEGGCPRATLPPVHSYESPFGRQGPVEAESPEWRIELLRREPSPQCGSGYRFSFAIRKRENRTTSTLALCNDWTRQVDEVDLISANKALMMVRASANFLTAILLDVPSGRLLDSFACFMPTLSPGNRFLAFLKSFPGHPGPVEISNEYLVYDLTRAADYNRPQPKPGKAFDQGWPVYPPGATNAAGENILPEGSPHHLLSSRGLFWLDDKTLAFADLFEGVNRLVVVDLGRGIRNPYVKTVELSAFDLVDLERCRGSAPASDFKVRSTEAAGLIQIANITPMPGATGIACLYFAPGPCLRHPNLMVRLP